MKDSRVIRSVFILVRNYLKCVKANERCSKAVFTVRGRIFRGLCLACPVIYYPSEGYQFYTLGC